MIPRITSHLHYTWNCSVALIEFFSTWRFYIWDGLLISSKINFPYQIFKQQLCIRHQNDTTNYSKDTDFWIFTYQLCIDKLVIQKAYFGHTRGTKKASAKLKNDNNSNSWNLRESHNLYNNFIFNLSEVACYVTLVQRSNKLCTKLCWRVKNRCFSNFWTKKFVMLVFTYGTDFW